MRHWEPSRSGAALVIILTVLTLLSILIVGLTQMSRIEQASARSYLERSRAGDMAQMGVDTVVGLLQQATADPNVRWINAPGRILFSAPNSRMLNSELSLSSGFPEAPQPPGIFARPNLDLPGNDGAGSITGNRNTPGIRPAWVYLRKNGLLDRAEIPDLTDRNNPIVGRFAFWTDDESSKVNCNFAWKRRAALLPISHPSNLNLPSLLNSTEADADTLHNAVTTDNYTTILRVFNTTAEPRGLSERISSLIADNRFSLTQFSHDPDTTFFNEKRIVLTTQADKAKGLPFLDILSTPNSDPGMVSKISQSKLNSTLTLLLGYLQRSDWPITEAPARLQDKYYAGNSARLIQLALNIIEYVRCRESTELLVDPIRGSWNGSTFTIGSATGTNGFIGPTRTPLIDELGIWLSPDLKTLKFRVELYLPPKYGIDSVDIGPMRSLFVYCAAGSQTKLQESAITAAECSTGTTVLNAGNYVTVTRTVQLDASPALVLSSRPSTLSIRVALSATARRLDIVPLIDTTSYLIRCPVDDASASLANIHSVEVDDPRVNKHYLDWRPCSGKNNTFDAVNSICSTGKAPSSVTPQQDTDASGKLSAASLYMPYPKGHPKNRFGTVSSPGELGYIHTGIESSSGAGVPWRTVRLQPNSSADTRAVPDWAFMDLFTVPSDIPQTADDLYKPHETCIAARINLNARTDTVTTARLGPLTAVFEEIERTPGGARISHAEAESMAKNIVEQKTASNGGKKYGHPDYFDSPGELVEIEGIADRGEDSEEIVRNAANLVTTRGNISTIYTIGQALRQTPSGQLNLTGEERQRVTVERYLDNVSGKVRFRLPYLSRVNP